MCNAWSLSQVRAAPCAVSHGICVALKHGLIIVSAYCFQLFMYSLTDGSLVRSLGKQNAHDEERFHFHFGAGGLCMSPDGDSVLLAEYNNNRVQEVRVMDGTRVRFIGEHTLSRPQYVDCNADIIVVSEWCHRISLFARGTGLLYARTGSEGSGLGQLFFPRGLRLLSNNSGVMVADGTNHRLCQFSVAGEFVQVLGSREHGLCCPRDVLECADGFVVANSWAHNLAKVVSSPETQDEVLLHCLKYQYPTALAPLADGGMVVLDRDRMRVLHGLTLRAAWLFACYTYGSA